MFARISRRYDLMNTVMTMGMHGRWRRLAAKLAAERCAGAGLDVGTGTGKLAFELSKNTGINQVVGLDFVPGMLAIARRGAAGPAAAKCRWVLGDAMALPFADGAFACAVTGFAMRNVEDVGVVLRELARVVRMGGKVAILEITPRDRPGRITRWLRWYFRHVVPWLGGLLAGDRAAYTYLPRSVETFPSPQELAGIMERAGMEHVRWRSLGLGLVSLHVGEVS